MASIRSELPADRDSIRRVHESAFPTSLEAQLVDALRAAGKLVVSLVAVEGDRIIGHVAFSPVMIIDRNGETVARGCGLAPLAVEPEFQRRGIGAALCTHGIETCRTLDLPFIVVLGEQRYYRRFGFRPAQEFALGNEYGAGEAFMVIELPPGGIPARGGLARYAPEFAELSA